MGTRTRRAWDLFFGWSRKEKRRKEDCFRKRKNEQQDLFTSLHAWRDAFSVLVDSLLVVVDVPETELPVFPLLDTPELALPGKTDHVIRRQIQNVGNIL